MTALGMQAWLPTVPSQIPTKSEVPVGSSAVPVRESWEPTAQLVQCIEQSCRDNTRESGSSRYKPEWAPESYPLNSIPACYLSSYYLFHAHFSLTQMSLWEGSSDYLNFFFSKKLFLVLLIFHRYSSFISYVNCKYLLCSISWPFLCSDSLSFFLSCIPPPDSHLSSLK